MPTIRAAHHPDLAVDHGCRAIQLSVSSPSRTFLGQRMERALLFVAAAHVLHHHGVPVLDERQVVRRDIECPCRRACAPESWAARPRSPTGRKTLADRLTPSRIGTGTCRFLIDRLCAAASAAAHASTRHQLSHKHVPIPLGNPFHPMAAPDMPGPPLADGPRQPQPSMLAESCAAAGIAFRRPGRDAHARTFGKARALLRVRSPARACRSHQADRDSGCLARGRIAQVDAGVHARCREPELPLFDRYGRRSTPGAPAAARPRAPDPSRRTRPRSAARTRHVAMQRGNASSTAISRLDSRR